MTNSISGYRSLPAFDTLINAKTDQFKLGPDQTLVSDSPTDDKAAPKLDFENSSKVLNVVLGLVGKNYGEDIRNSVQSDPRMKHLFESSTPVSPKVVSIIRSIADDRSSTKPSQRTTKLPKRTTKRKKKKK
jgi:hypothetical protein